MQVKWKIGNYIYHINKEAVGDNYELSFPYNKTLIDEIKITFSNPRWNPNKRSWVIANNNRNTFRIAFMEGQDVYNKYNKSLEDYPSRFDSVMYTHQKTIKNHILTRHYCHVPGEMGVGKTLAAFSAIDCANIVNSLWVVPKGAIPAINLEVRKWKIKSPIIIHYEFLHNYINWLDTGMSPLPQMIIFDESQKLKNHKTKRWQAADILVNRIKAKYGKDGFVVLMTGTPSPKSPIDWWAQIELICPGFLREGSPDKFRDRLAIVRKEESLLGITFPKVIAWKDSTDRCKICGTIKSDHPEIDGNDFHTFKEGINEIETLYRRLNGMAYIVRKKDCLDLPEKHYQIFEATPTLQTKRLAELITKTSKTAIEKLIRLRELSDGFQYISEQEVIGECNCIVHCKAISDDYLIEACPNCGGSKVVKKVVRNVSKTETPKDEMLANLLDEYEDDGRFIVYAGFTESIDRITNNVNNLDWDYIRVDGRGWHSNFSKDRDEMYRTFQRVDINNDRKICFIAHPASGGISLTLTESKIITYFSNDFNGDYRMQSEDRIHRPGCKGARIVDLFHLPSDRLVYENLKKKKDLQNLTLGEIDDALR